MSKNSWNMFDWITSTEAMNENLDLQNHVHFSNKTDHHFVYICNFHLTCTNVWASSSDARHVHLPKTPLPCARQILMHHQAREHISLCWKYFLPLQKGPLVSFCSMTFDRVFQKIFRFTGLRRGNVLCANNSRAKFRNPDIRVLSATFQPKKRVQKAQLHTFSVSVTSYIMLQWIIRRPNTIPH